MDGSEGSIGGSGLTRVPATYAGPFVKGDVITIAAFARTAGSVTTRTQTSDTFLAVTQIPDLSVYGVQGQVEILSAESNSVALTATNRWMTLSGNSVTLSPGVWRLTGQTSCEGLFRRVRTRWADVNGDNSTSTPVETNLLSVLINNASTQGVIDRTDDTFNFIRFNAPTLLVKVTSPASVFLNANANYGGGGSATITTNITAERIA